MPQPFMYVLSSVYTMLAPVCMSDASLSALTNQVQHMSPAIPVIVIIGLTRRLSTRGTRPCRWLLPSGLCEAADAPLKSWSSSQRLSSGCISPMTACRRSGHGFSARISAYTAAKTLSAETVIISTILCITAASCPRFFCPGLR